MGNIDYDTTYADTCKLTNTNNGVEVEAEILKFIPEKIITASVGRSVKVTLNFVDRNANRIYVGNLHGVEFISEGPEETINYRGRRR